MASVEANNQWQEEFEDDEEDILPLQGRRPRLATNGNDTSTPSEPPPAVITNPADPLPEEEEEEAKPETETEAKPETETEAEPEAENIPKINGNGNGSIVHSEHDNGNSAKSIVEEEAEAEDVKVHINGNGGSTDVHGDGGSAAQDGNGGLGKSVYFDKEKGIWNCVHCQWTYKTESPRIDHTQNPRGHTQMPMKAKTLDHQEPSFNYVIEGTEYTYEFSASQYMVSEPSLLEANPGDQVSDVREKNSDAQNSLTTVTKHHHEENLKTERLSNLSPSTKHGKAQETNFKPSNNGMIESEEVFPLEEAAPELIEYDVERVLKKQDTHDLYCPNCNSCITRKVILRKRKRIIKESDQKPKRDKFVAVADPKLDTISEEVPQSNGPDEIENSREEIPLPEDNHNDDREPEVFRCLSCFSFIIPTGNGFKLFRIFGGKNDSKDVQNQPPVSATATKSKWFFSSVASDKGTIVVEQGNQLNTPLLANDMLPQPESDNTVVSISSKVRVNAGKPAEDATLQQRKIDYLSTTIAGGALASAGKPAEAGTFPHHKTDNSFTAGLAVVNTTKPAEVTVSKPQLGEVKFLVPSTVGSLLTEEPRIKMDQKNDIAAGHEAQSDQDGRSSSIQGAPSLLQSSSVGGLEYDTATAELKNDDTVTVVTSSQTFVLLEKTTTTTHSGERSDDADAVDMNKTEVTQFNSQSQFNQTSVTQGAPNIIPSEETENPPEIGIQIDGNEQGAEASEVHGWDILKSIVYGGLIESITSLGVVTSAAGAGATTLNVFAMGLANLIGGLFIIGHNLWDLKNDHPRTSSSQVDGQVNRYNELLGQRNNFTLHAIVALLSYLIFGLIPPIVYAFSFRISNDVDYKLGAVLGASLLCIILLAIGKVHVQTPPKSYIKTLVYYVTVAILASGASYIVGNLIKKLLEQLGLFDSSSGFNAPLIEIQPVRGSYELGQIM